MLRGTIRRISIVAILAFAGSLTPAQAQVPFILAVPGSWLMPTFGQPAAMAQVGGELTFVNLDAMYHDVRAVQKPGQYAPVQCTSPNPEICPEGTPEWCLPEIPGQVWGNNNSLPFPPGQCPIFWSELIPIARTTPVLGLEYLTSGRAYDFFCSRHPAMTGTLVAV